VPSCAEKQFARTVACCTGQNSKVLGVSNDVERVRVAEKFEAEKSREY